MIDQENDTITYDNSLCEPDFNVSINTTTGVWSGIPGLSHVSTSHKLCKTYPQDQHYPDNGGDFWGTLVYVYNNTPPINTSTIPDKSYDAGYALSFSFPDTLFSDEDGEAVSLYRYTSTPDATGWLSFDSASRTFSGTPAVNDDAFNYTINVTAEDPNPNSDDGLTSFKLYKPISISGISFGIMSSLNDVRPSSE